VTLCPSISSAAALALTNGHGPISKAQTKISQLTSQCRYSDCCAQVFGLQGLGFGLAATMLHHVLSTNSHSGCANSVTCAKKRKTALGKSK